MGWNGPPAFECKNPAYGIIFLRFFEKSHFLLRKMQTKVLEYAPQFVVDLLSARVVKLVDTRDLKSLARKGVPVRLRLRAPNTKKADSVRSRPFLLASALVQSCAAVGFIGCVKLSRRRLLVSVV